MNKTTVPTKEADLVQWMTDNSAKLTANPTKYFFDVDSIKFYTIPVASYIAAYNVGVDPETRTKPKIAAKDALRIVAEKAASQLVQLVRGQPSMTAELMLELGINPRKTPSPINAPTTAPALSVVSIVGDQATLKAAGVSGSSRAKAAGAATLRAYLSVGPQPTQSVSEYAFAGVFNRTSFTLTIPTDVPAGSQVWVTAQWVSPTQVTSPAANPISLSTFNKVISAEAGMKLAA